LLLLDLSHLSQVFSRYHNLSQVSDVGKLFSIFTAALLEFSKSI